MSILILALCAFFPSVVFSGPATYQYDALDRLTRSISASGTVTIYEYDAEGNRTRMVRTTGVLAAPQAAFTADVTGGDVSLQVHFYDQSSGIVEGWTWDFGDGETSEEQNPIHTYSTPGTYTVTLTASNRDAQDSLTQSAFITVLSPLGPRPSVTISHGFSPGYTGAIDFNGDLKVGFQVTLDNSGEEDAVVDVAIDLADSAFVMVTPPQNCIYDSGTKTFEKILVPAGESFEINYVAKYQGSVTSNGNSVVNTAAIRRIAGWYDVASGMNRGGYMNLTAAATATVTAQSMILGTVRDMSTEQTIYSAMITATGGKNTATDTHGFYRLLLNPGVYSVSISKSGYQTASLSTVVVYSNRATFLNVDLTTPGVLAIATFSIDDGQVGEEQNPKIKISGGVYPYTYSLVSGNLPPGILLDTANGNLSGTPTSGGTFTFTIGVRDTNSAYVERQFTQTIGEPLNFQTGFDLPRGTKGAAYSTDVVAVGGTPPYTYAIVSGALPSGLQLTQGGGIAGVPDSLGQHYFTVRADDAEGGTALRDFTFGVDDQLKIETDRLFSGITGTAFNQDLDASGGYGEITWSVIAGTLPSGILLQGGRLAGTPVVSGSGTVTLRVSDAVGRAAQNAFAWDVGAPLLFATQTLPPALKGRPYEATLAASGGVGAIAFCCISPFPPGLTLHPETGIVSGTTAILGLSNVVVRVMDQAYPDQQVEERTFSFRVVEPPLIKGDVNKDGMIEMQDLILTLQVMSGRQPSEPIHKDAEVDGDGKIGIAEVLYVIQRISGLR